MAMPSKDLAGLRELIMENAKFIFPYIQQMCTTAHNEASVIIRCSGTAEHPIFQACLIYTTMIQNKSYLAYESAPKTTIEMAMTLLLEKTAAAAERGFEARVLRTS